MTTCIALKTSKGIQTLTDHAATAGNVIDWVEKIFYKTINGRRFGIMFAGDLSDCQKIKLGMPDMINVPEAGIGDDRLIYHGIIAPLIKGNDNLEAVELLLTSEDNRLYYADESGVVFELDEIGVVGSGGKTVLAIYHYLKTYQRSALSKPDLLVKMMSIAEKLDLYTQRRPQES